MLKWNKSFPLLLAVPTYVRSFYLSLKSVSKYVLYCTDCCIKHHSDTAQWTLLMLLKESVELVSGVSCCSIISLSIPLLLSSNKLLLLKHFLVLQAQVIVLDVALGDSWLLHHIDKFLQCLRLSQIIRTISASVVAFDEHGALAGVLQEFLTLLLGFSL